MDNRHGLCYAPRMATLTLTQIALAYSLSPRAIRQRFRRARRAGLCGGAVLVREVDGQPVCRPYWALPPQDARALATPRKRGRQAKIPAPA